LSTRLKMESRSIDYVPSSERYGKVWQLWPVWFTGDAQLATLATGAISVLMGLSLAWSSLAIVGGCALGTFFMAFHSTQGPQMGLPQMIQSRPQFGYVGALLVWGVALFTYVGYSAFNDLLAGQALTQLTGARPTLAFVPFTLASVALAAAGYHWIHLAQRVLAYLMIAALLVFSVGVAFTIDLGPAGLALGPFHRNMFLVQFFSAAAYQLSWSIYVSDYSRYLPRDVGVASSFWWTFLGAMLGGVWMMLAGAVAAAFAPRQDIVAALVAAGDSIHSGFGIAILLASLLGLMSITSLNLYGAMLTLLSIGNTMGSRRAARFRLPALALVAGAATLFAYLSPPDIMEAYENLLAIFLYLFTPWTAINLVDFYFVRRAHYSVREIFNPDGMYGRWAWRGIAAYGLGIAAMVPFFSTGFFKGPVAVAFGGADMSMLVGLPVAAGAYFLFCRSLDLEEDRRRAHAADLGLDDGEAPGGRG
jgi:NCS1 family nucleobase:cation symporter-1